MDISPILREAVFEVRLRNPKEWDLSFPGLFYEKIKNKFPEKEEKTFIDVSEPLRISSSKELAIAPVLFVKSKRERKGVAVASGRIKRVSVHYLAPVQDINLLREDVLFVINALLDTIKSAPLDRIALRFITEILLPMEEKEGKYALTLSDYFQIGPGTGPSLSNYEMVDFRVGVTFSLSKEIGLCRVTFYPLKIKEPGKDKFVLDVESFKSFEKGTFLEQQKVETWYNLTYSAMQEMFNNLLTEKTIEICSLKGGK